MSKSIKKINGFPIMDEKARTLLSTTKTDINNNFDKISTLFSTETADNKVILKFNSIVIAEIPIGTISGDINYSISNNLDQNITSNGTSSVVKDQPYTCSLTPKSGYKITSIRVTMNGEDITSSCVNGNNINIPKVTGSVIITAKSTQILNSFTITNTLNNSTNNNTSTSVEENTRYTCSITPNKGYAISKITLIMGGVDRTSDYVSGTTIIIPKVTGNIEITVTTEQSIKSFTITNNLTNAKNSNASTTIEENKSYNATITPNNGYKLEKVTITMNGTDITSEVYNNGAISISSVNGDIIITVTTVESEEIITYTVTNNLTNYTNTNNAKTIKSNTQYGNARLEPKLNYKVGSVVITMGGVDITNSVYNPISRNIIIPKPNGDIVINATGIEYTPNIENESEITICRGNASNLSGGFESSGACYTEDLIPVNSEEIMFAAYYEGLIPYIRCYDSDKKYIGMLTGDRYNQITIPWKTGEYRSLQLLSNTKYIRISFLRASNKSWVYTIYPLYKNIIDNAYLCINNTKYTFKPYQDDGITGIINAKVDGNYTVTSQDPVLSYTTELGKTVVLHPVTLPTINKSFYDIEFICDENNATIDSNGVLTRKIDTQFEVEMKVKINDTKSFSTKVAFEDLQVNTVNTLSSVNMAVGETYAIPFSTSPVIDYKNARLDDTNTDKSIIKLNQDNTINALKDGETEINLVVKNKTKTIKVVVGKNISDEDEQYLLTELAKKHTRNIKEIMIANPIDKMQVGDLYTLWAIGLQDETENAFRWDMRGDNNSVSITSSNSNIISCNFGVLRANAPGTATITAKYIGQDVKTTFDVVVSNKQDTDASSLKILNVDLTEYGLDNNGTKDSGTKNTEGIIRLFEYASNNNYEKIIFPTGTYNVQGDVGTIYYPSDMIVDWNNSNIQLEERKSYKIAEWHNVNPGNKYAYNMFEIEKVKNLIVMNGKFYAENHLFDKKYHIEHELTLEVVGAKNIKIVNCEFNDAPGFNVGLGDANNRASWTPFKLGNCEVGGLTDTGENDDTKSESRFRSNDFINLAGLNKVTDTLDFGVGCIQGYGGYAYVTGRIYNICFYDKDKKFISKIENCIQFFSYERPQNSVYCKLEFFQKGIPTKSDPDFDGVVHLYALHKTKDLQFIGCKFKEAMSTGISPQGGNNVLIKDCEFINCGYYDPAAAFDWEDGGLHIYGHIVDNCKFISTGKALHYIISVKSRGVVLCNNELQDTTLDMRVDSETYRIFKNNWISNRSGASRISVSAKTDAVMANNTYVKGIKFNIGTTYGDNTIWNFSNIEL